MTEPSQYFKGRTVQEQMNEVIGYVDTRAAEVATTAIASDVAQVHQDMLDADADAQAAAASAAAAAGTLANAVKKTGEASQSIAGNIEVSGTLKSTGTLYAIGDATVGGNLGVGGSTNVGDLTATGVVTVPTVATGTFDEKAVNGTKLQNEILNNASIVRTSNNQTIGGVKTFTSSIVITGTGNNGVLANPPGIVQDATGTNQQVQYLRTTCPDSNGVTKELMFLQLLDNADGTRTLRLNLYSSTGVRGIKNLATIQPDGTIS